MSSYLSEVLSCVERINIDQLKIKCSEVESSVDKCKRDLFVYLEDIYVRFNDRPRENKAFANKIKSLQDEISMLAGNIENVVEKDLSTSSNGMMELLASLQYVDGAKNLVSALYDIHELLVEIKELRKEQEYFVCMKKIKEVEDVFNTLTPDDNLPIVQDLRLRLCPEKQTLLDTLYEEFGNEVILELEENRTVIKIMSGREYLQSVFSALYFDQTSVVPLDKFAQFLWNNVFVPVVDCVTEVESKLENNGATLDCRILDSNKKSSYAEVFANIKAVLSFLSTNFNIGLSEELTTLQYLGDHIRVNLSELIIKHCLEDTIPSTSEGLKQYQVVIDATQDLEKALVESKIFEPGTTPILEYVNNINVLFINKKCHGYMVAAKALMQKDLHDLVEVGEVQNSGSLEETTIFPRCSISRSVQDLLLLLQNILEQATTTSDVCTRRLFTTAKTICHMYTTFVPEQHKKLLQTIPQQIAVFYNNCMYISRKLTEWSETHLKLLPGATNVYPRNFDNESLALRQVAAEMFSSYVQAQIEQIQDIMKESGLRNKQTLDLVEPSTDKCLRQCLRQQELLKTVWNNVLPYSVYNETLGSILDSLCNEFITAIIKFEDISSEAAEQLVELFRMVQTRGLKLFTDTKEINLFVSNWYKLNELGFVLGASLVDINDRWADGKGPLALQFKPEELKPLVRALFQNTERRAALLAKIHD